MNKGIIFGLGVLAGGAAGVGITYVALRSYFENKAAESIQQYVEYVENKYHSPEEDDEFFDDVDEEDEDEPLVKKDSRAWSEEDEAPIKKYHHYVPDEKTLSANGIFEKKGDKEVTEGEKALIKHPEFDPDGDPNVKEITEDKYQEIMGKEPIDGWSNDQLTYLYPQDELYFGYGTDNEELAEDHYGVGREEIIGQTWRWATDYTDGESGVGYIYIDNANLKKVFDVEVVVDLELEGEEDV